MPSTLGITFNRSKKKWHWKKLHNHNEHNYISINFFLSSNIISHHRTKRTSHTLEGYRINFQYLFKVHKFKLNKHFIWFFFFIHHNLSSVFDCEVNSPNVWCHILFILIIIESWSNFTNFFLSTCAFIINKIFKSVYSYSFCMFYKLLRISEWKKIKVDCDQDFAIFKRWFSEDGPPSLKRYQFHQFALSQGQIDHKSSLLKVSFIYEYV